jgi:geranylgeranyl diphosphate synthase type I
MFKEISRRLENEINNYIKDIDKLYSLNKISPLLSRDIKDFILRAGKRARPILFVAGYLGFAKKQAPGLYRSSLSIELLHNFMLIHDDIIDKSDTRRGKPSLHKSFGNYLRGLKDIKFNGTDLAIVAGDVMYAMAIDALLSIKERPELKEKALKKLIEATIYTGAGEFIELLYGAKKLKQITKQDIYKIYTFKTAHYTFTCPLSIGAILGGADSKQIGIISQYGSYLGIAFQIKDDILGLFGEEEKTGKSPLVDLQEAKKTILIWYAYNYSQTKDKLMIENILRKKTITKSDLFKIREIVIKSGAKKFAEIEISSLLGKALKLITSSKMLPQYKNALYNYSKQILS